MSPAPDATPIDTTATIEIAQSPWKMLGIAAACLAVMAGSAFLAFGPPADSQGSIVVVVGIAGLVVFGLFSALILWRALTARGPALIISPAGLHDVRVSARPIPWNSLRRMYTWSYQGQRILVVDIEPEVERSLGLTRIAAWTRGPNRALGADGLSVTAQGLKISYDRLYELALAFAQAHGGRQVSPPR